MSVFVTMLVLTTKDVSAKEYVADDNYNVTSQYHDIFNNYFDGKKSYLYFPYSCDTGSYSRECYFGIDEDGNYLDINYVSNGSSYEVNYSTGIDEEFSVTGNNVFRKDVSEGTVIAYALIFTLILVVVYNLLVF